MLDSRWAGLVARHPRASAFHTIGWLDALRRTYGFDPVAYTTSPPGRALDNGIVFCRVETWLAGRHLVSLPFSDHCAPLLNDALEERLFISGLKSIFDREKFTEIEIRASDAIDGGEGICRSTREFWFHRLDLKPDPAALLGSFHKNSIQRKIRRAAREGLVCESGRSETHLEAFWTLFLMTRRRHRILPPPLSWFRNLIGCLGESLRIRIALKDNRPVAAILTIRHGDTLVYKYGCSDRRVHNLGGMPFLFWTAIQDARRDGLTVLDFGRTDFDNPGLLTFKDRWGTSRSTLTYSTFAPVRDTKVDSGHGGSGWKMTLGGFAAAHLPDPVFSAVGSVLYRHFD